MSGNSLEGIRVLDFGTAWAGPMAAHILADMGAEVIKVESRTHIDGARLGRPIVGDDIDGGDKGKWVDMQPQFHGLNRNKYSITVNLHVCWLLWNSSINFGKNINRFKRL